MNNTIDSMSYVTYEYDVHPRIVEKHASSNTIKTPINGANIKINIDSTKVKNTQNIILYKIKIINEGNMPARNIKIVDGLNNINFIKGTISINGYKIPNHELRNGFLFKCLNKNECIDITFKVKAIIPGDINSLISGFYYFINNKNQKVYRKALSNLSKTNIYFSSLLFDIKYDKIPIQLGKRKTINTCLKNIGNIEAKKIKFSVLLPNELNLNYTSIFVNNKNTMPEDKYSFFVENLKENESQEINFNIEFIKFKGRYKVPLAIFCTFYNITDENIYEKYDSELIKLSVDLIPNRFR